MNIADQVFEWGNSNKHQLLPLITTIRRFAKENQCDVNDIELGGEDGFGIFYDGLRRVIIDVYCYEVNPSVANEIEDVRLTETKYSEIVAVLGVAARHVSLNIDYPVRWLVIEEWSWLKWDRLQVLFSERHVDHYGHNCQDIDCGRIS